MKKQLSILISFFLSLNVIFQVNLNSVLASQIQINNLSCVFKTYKTATLNWTIPKDESGNEIKNLSVKVQQSINSQEWRDSILCDSKKEIATKETSNDTGTLTVIGLEENITYKFRLVISDGANTTYSNEISVITSSKNDANNKIIQFPNSEFQKVVSQVLNKGNQNLGISDINELRYLNMYADNLNDVVGIQYFQSLEHLNKFKAELKDDSINLTWSNPNNQIFSKVIIVRKQGSYPINQSDGIKVYEGNGANYIDENLTYGQSYYYRAFLYSKEGQVSINTFGDLVSSKINNIITNLKLDAQGDQINLTWINPTDKDFNHVEIYRSNNPMVSSNLSDSGGELVYSDNGHSFVDKDVYFGQVYYYWCVGVDNNSNRTLILDKENNYASISLYNSFLLPNLKDYEIHNITMNNTQFYNFLINIDGQYGVYNNGWLSCSNFNFIKDWITKSNYNINKTFYYVSCRDYYPRESMSDPSIDFGCLWSWDNNSDVPSEITLSKEYRGWIATSNNSQYPEHSIPYCLWDAGFTCYKINVVPN